MKIFWIITWKHRRGDGFSFMEETLASTRREAWRKGFKWYTEGYALGSPEHHQMAAQFYQRRNDGTHRAMKVKLSAPWEPTR